MYKFVNFKILYLILSLGFLNFVLVLIICVCIEDGIFKMIVICLFVGIGCDI